MTDSSSYKTLNSPITIETCTNTNNNSKDSDSSIAKSDSDHQLPLSRNSSFSKLNAKAPEFVPMKPSQSQSPPIPTDPRLIVIPPPPPLPTVGNVHVYSPVPVRVVPYQYQPQLVDHTLRYQRKQEGVGKSQSQGDANGNDKDQVNVASSQSSVHNGLSDEAAQKLINQVEYYFSDVNLATTDHLIKFIVKDPEGFVPISVVASFKKIKALISSNSQLAAVLRNSIKLAISADGKKVKRLHPLTVPDMEVLQARIIVAENLPEDHCHQNLMKIFSVGSVKSIRTCQPQPSNNGASSASKSSKSDSYNYNSKVHAFVEYDTVELAEKAIAELNVEDSWRNGLRVRPLLKPVLKPTQGRTKKAGNEGEVYSEDVSVSTSEQNQNEKLTERVTPSPDAQSPDNGDEQSTEKDGAQKKSRNRSKGKGRGRGFSPNNHNHHHPNNKSPNNDQPFIARTPPPGPRMPDGTRGFSMGRGKPVAVNTA